MYSILNNHNNINNNHKKKSTTMKVVNELPCVYINIKYHVMIKIRI